ncbi:hypothetical protein JW835_08635 [bacterium]|nr:hypothetical protein [bacterium]
MSKFIDDLKQTSQKLFSSAKVKADEYAKIGKAKGEIVILKQKLTKAYSDLGEAVRPLLEKDKKSPLAENEPVKASLKKITDIEKSIKEKEKEIEAAKKEAEAKTEGNQQVKTTKKNKSTE